MQILGTNFKTYINNFANVKTNCIRKSPCFTSQIYFQNNEDSFTRNPLNKFKNFTIEEYKKLSKDEIAQINKEIDDLGYKKYDYPVKMHNLICTGMKTYLDKKYGENNYTVITIGRSVSSVGKCLSYKIGEDNVKNIPMSCAGRFCMAKDYDTQPEDINKFNQYLSSIGLSKEDIENSEKNYVIVDYCDTGASLFGAEKLLQSEKVWNNQPNVYSENIVNMFNKMDKNILKNTEFDTEQKFRFNAEFIFWNGMYKKYSLVDKCTDLGKTADCVLKLDEEPTYKKQFLFKLLDNEMKQ